MFTTPEFTPTSTRNLWAQLAHAVPAGVSAPAEKLLQGLSSERLASLLSSLPRVSLSVNEEIQVRQESDAAMGILVHGALGLGVGGISDPHFVYVIQPGEPFGELTTLTRVPSDSVFLALEASEVLLLPVHLLERLGTREPDTAIHLYKNLLAILAKRVAAINTFLGDQLNRRAGTPRIRRPARHKAASIRKQSLRKDSYQIHTLSDPKGELERLSRQAQVAESLELKVLKEIGLTPGDSVLDLGSGPGLTSLLLARHFPGCRITGVEPETSLRTTAQAMAQERQLDQCVFLEGTAQSIPLPSGAMDFAYARLLFQHIPDPLAGLAEMKRVTRPGGIVCVLDVDDGTIFIHPGAPEWKGIDARVARAQESYGGDRHVGRKLLGYFMQTGLSQVQVDVVPVTTQMFGPEVFYDIVFGFKMQHLKRVGDWDRETERAFLSIRESLMAEGAFASENMFVAHGVVPGP